MVCLHDLCAGSAPEHSFFPFSWHLANPRGWEDLGIAPFHQTIHPKVHIPDIAHPTFYSTTAQQLFWGSFFAPTFISSEPPLRTLPLLTPPLGLTCDPPTNANRVCPSQPSLNFVDGKGYIVLRGGGGGSKGL